MVGCSAPNCHNSTLKGVRLFGFPSDKDRRRKWITNCRRDKWSPTSGSRICEVHFEHSQFENNRKDGRRKLRPNAVPTIFHVPNPSHLLDSRRKILKCRASDDGDVLLKMHFEESQFEHNRKDGKRKLKPNAVPTIYQTTKNSRRQPVKRNRVSLSDLPDQNNQTASDVQEISSDNEDHPTMKKKKLRMIKHLQSLSRQPDAVAARKKTEALSESFGNEDNGNKSETTGSEAETTKSNRHAKHSNFNGSTRGGTGMASSRAEPLRSAGKPDRAFSFDRAQTPSISLEKQMHVEEENLLKEWDTTVKCREENSLSIRPISFSTEDPIRTGATKAKPRLGGSASKTSSSVDVTASGAVRFDFPEIDVVKRHDTSLGDSAEIVDDDARRFTYTECPTTGRKTMRLEMNVEGFEPEDITVKSFGGRLTVHGIAQDVCNGQKSTNEFCRKIKLPDDVSSENLRCTFADQVLVLEAPVRMSCSSSPVGASSHPLNHPVILSDENGRYLSLVVDIGRLFRPNDVVVKVKGQQTICVVAETVENTTFSRMKAKLEREFDLPEKIDQRSLRAGCTEDRLLKIVARVRDSNEQSLPRKSVRIDVGDSVD